MERIPFWERPPAPKPEPRQPIVNLISGEEIQYLRFQDPMADRVTYTRQSQAEKDIRRVLAKVNGFFDARPEESLLSWLCLWKAKTPQQAKQVVQQIRNGQGKMGRYGYRCLGLFVYFTRFPDGVVEDWTPDQREAYRLYQNSAARHGGRPKGTGHPTTKVWHCEHGHEWLAIGRGQQCPHMLDTQPCPGTPQPGNAPDGQLRVVNMSRPKKPVPSPRTNG